MTDIKLSKRMQAVCDMVDCDSVCDIGCDHAHVSIWLAMHKVKKVVAMDVKKGPVEIATENVNAYGLSEVISVRQSDGFDKLEPDEAACAVIAGMGGALMTGILERGNTHLLRGIHLVLQPQSEIHKVREFLCRNNYIITDEKMLVEDEKFYTIIKALPACHCADYEKTQKYAEEDLLYGKILIDRKDAVLREFLLCEKQKLLKLENSLKNVDTASSSERAHSISRELSLINQVLDRL